MTQLNISAPDALDLDRAQKLANLQAEIDNGLASPPSQRSLDEIVDEGFHRIA
jgi:hypothetical protein